MSEGSMKQNISKGRGNITRFKPADGSKKEKPQQRKIDHDDGFNIGTFDVNGSNDKKEQK